MGKFVFYVVAGWVSFQLIKLFSNIGHLVNSGQCLVGELGFICDLSTLSRIALFSGLLTVFAVLIALTDFWLFRRAK